MIQAVVIANYNLSNLGVAVTLANALERQDARLLDLWDKAVR